VIAAIQIFLKLRKNLSLMERPKKRKNSPLMRLGLNIGLLKKPIMPNPKNYALSVQHLTISYCRNLTWQCCTTPLLCFFFYFFSLHKKELTRKLQVMVGKFLKSIVSDRL
jgi:hypothetical protein